MLTDVTLYVSNHQAALAFYALLGGSPDNDGSGMVWFGDTAVQLWEGKPASNVRLSINVADPQTVAARLTDEGHPVEWTDKQRRMFTACDPDGNKVMVRDSSCWRH
jgi:hypothetical protein